MVLVKTNLVQWLKWRSPSVVNIDKAFVLGRLQAVEKLKECTRYNIISVDVYM